MDPGPFTLRELDLMAEGRSRSLWAHTSSVLALLANAHRDPTTQISPFRPADFNPHVTPARDDVIPVEVKEIKDLLLNMATKTKGRHG